MIKISNLCMALYLLISIISCGWERDYRDAAVRSIQKDTDLILVPYPFNLLDNYGGEASTLSHFSKEELKEIMIEHDLSWDDLKENWGWEESHLEFEKEVKYTSHYTNYSYDSNIPIWLYGPKWIRSGVYSDQIYQQHIPSIYARLLQHPFEKEIDLKKFDKVFRETKEKPEIIVTIIVDQGGDQLYKAHPNSFPFLKSFKNQSAYFKNAKVAHLEAHTVVGHAAIGTGKFPNTTEVFSNEVYTWKNGKVVSRPVFQGKDYQLDLSQFKSLTLADDWDYANNNIPVIISQCYAARASIGMAGHGKDIPIELLDKLKSSSSNSSPDRDFVYWANSLTLRWDTFDKAFEVPSSNQKVDFYEFYLSNKGKVISTFEAKDRVDFSKKVSLFQSSEYQVALDGYTIRNSIEKEIINKNLHNDKVTDLVYVTLKATDAVGHAFGWESKESERVLTATDMEIRKIFDFLRSHYDDKFLLLVTADHGAAPMHVVSKGSFLTHKNLFELVSTLLPEAERNNESLIQWVTHSQMSLNYETMKKFNVSESQIIQLLSNFEMDGKLFFRKIWTRQDLGVEPR